MVKNMIGAYGNTDIALHGGAMLRECIRYENLARMTLYDETLWLFFDQVCSDTSLRSSDALTQADIVLRFLSFWLCFRFYVAR